MATRTEPMRLSLFLLGCTRRDRVGAVGWIFSGDSDSRLCRGRFGDAFVVDQFGEPADFPLDRLQTVSVEFQRVCVDPCPGALDGSSDVVDAFLEPAPAALEDLQPDLLGRRAEEREVDTEVL